MPTFPKTILFSCLIISSCTLTAKEESWWEIAGTPVDGKSLPACGGTKAILYTDTAARSALRGFILPTPATRFPSAPDEARQKVSKLSAEFQTLSGSSPSLNLTIDWLGRDGLPTKENHEIHLKDGRIRNTYRIRSTTIFRTVLVAEDGTVFIHFQTDQPGALSFKVSLFSPAPFESRIEDRRQMILTPTDQETSLRSHVWVIPFESDVATEGKSISVSGEGEALIIWSFSPGKTPPETLAGTLEALGKLYDPGDIPANPSLIWHGVLEKHLKSAENSP